MLPINSGKQVEVATITVDAFIQENDIDAHRIKFMKIDVEGYEYFVLKGAHQVLSHISYLHTEYSPGYMKKGGVDAHAFVDLLYSYQLSPHRIDTQGNLHPLTKEQITALQKGINILWIR